jgi:hypothetical protein
MTAVTDQYLAAIIARAEELMRSGHIKATQCAPLPKRVGAGRNRGKGTAFDWLCRHVNHEGKKCLFWPFSKAYGHPAAVGYCGKVYKPTRLMCLLAHGVPPSDQHRASHTCGRGINGCIHPQHLAWKTETEFRQNLERVGVANYGRGGKITPTQADEIKAIGDSEARAVIAKRYGISAQRVGQILLGHGFARQRKPYSEINGRFFTRIVFRGKHYSLGTYATSEQATSVYHSALARLRLGETPLPAKKDLALFDDVKRWYRPPAQRLQFGDRKGELITATEGEQEDSVFLLHNALNDLHPRVKKFVMMMSVTGDLMEAALAAGLTQEQVTAVLHRLIVKLGPLLRFAG